jgi:hypothetical protein
VITSDFASSCTQAMPNQAFQSNESANPVVSSDGKPRFPTWPEKISIVNDPETASRIVLCLLGMMLLFGFNGVFVLCGPPGHDFAPFASSDAILRPWRPVGTSRRCKV